MITFVWVWRLRMGQNPQHWWLYFFLRSNPNKGTLHNQSSGLMTAVEAAHSYNMYMFMMKPFMLKILHSKFLGFALVRNAPSPRRLARRSRGYTFVGLQTLNPKALTPQILKFNPKTIKA